MTKPINEQIRNISFKADATLADEFRTLAKANNRNQSTLLRDFMHDYVKNHQSKTQANQEDRK